MQIVPTDIRVYQPDSAITGGGRALAEDPEVRADIPPVIPAEADAAAQNESRQSVGDEKPGQQTAQTEVDAEDVEAAAANNQGAASRTATRPQPTAEQLSEADQAIIAQLKARDQEVRVHEAAHKAAGGQFTGAMQLEYEQGPDGKRYAVGGEVSIDVGPVSGDPQATVDKARTIQQAALAPAQPSAQDRRVAAQAMQMELKAMQELRLEEEALLQAESTQRTTVAGGSDAAPGASATADDESAQVERAAVVEPVVEQAATDFPSVSVNVTA